MNAPTARAAAAPRGRRTLMQLRITNLTRVFPVSFESTEAPSRRHYFGSVSVNDSFVCTQ